ncbi:MAG: hypothetical protein IJK74_08860 [Bacteroidales bacterium]|nr:hypothetical protein [Bacteroidales bacterium]
MKRFFTYCALLLAGTLLLSCSKSEKGGKGYESYALTVTLTRNYSNIPKDAEGHSMNPQLDKLYKDLSTDMEKFFANRSSKWIVEFDTKDGEKTIEAKDEDAKKKMEDLVAAYKAWLEKNYASHLADHATYGKGTIEIQYTATLDRSQKKNIVSPQIMAASYSN